MITVRPHAVWWKIGEMHYQLMEVRPTEFAKIREQLDDVIGIPCVYTFIDDDVEWWPQCYDGEFVLVPDNETTKRQQI